jgi:hypothetical protein
LAQRIGIPAANGFGDGIEVVLVGLYHGDGGEQKDDKQEIFHGKLIYEHYRLQSLSKRTYLRVGEVPYLISNGQKSQYVRLTDI